MKLFVLMEKMRVHYMLCKRESTRKPAAVHARWLRRRSDDKLHQLIGLTPALAPTSEVRGGARMEIIPVLAIVYR